MMFFVEIAPAVILFLVVVVATIPAIGLGRMLLLGASAFYTVGAFTSAWIVAPTETPGTLSFLCGCLGGTLAGIAMGTLCSRLRGDYFALATLCFAELLRLALIISPPFPGPQGIPGIARGTLAQVSIESPLAMVVAALILLLSCSLMTSFLMTAPWGASLRAVHDHEIGAKSSGLPVGRIRLGALTYAGLWGGAAGALGARFLSLADVESFALPESILVLVVVLLAGRPSVPRCLLMGATVAAFSELLRFLATGAFRQIAFGLILFGLAFMLREDLRSADHSGGQL